jgi:hypothetical protein
VSLFGWAKKPRATGAEPLVVETMGSRDLGPCTCCGEDSRNVWGVVHRGPVSEAAYYVHWTPGRVAEHGAVFDLVLGAWGDGTSRSDRYAVSLTFRWTANGPEFMVIDAATRPIRDSELLSRALAREDVIGTPLLMIGLEVINSICINDFRLN